MIRSLLWRPYIFWFGGTQSQFVKQILVKPRTIMNFLIFQHYFLHFSISWFSFTSSFITENNYMDITHFFHCSLRYPTSLTLKLKHRIPFKHRKDFPLWERSNTGSGCSGTLCSLLSWRYSEQNWTQSWATCCSWHCLEQRNLTRSSSDVPFNLTYSRILWLLTVFPSAQNTLSLSPDTKGTVIEYTNIREDNHRVIQS